jgi:hypothetical protein
LIPLEDFSGDKWRATWFKIRDDKPNAIKFKERIRMKGAPVCRFCGVLMNDNNWSAHGKWEKASQYKGAGNICLKCDSIKGGVYHLKQIGVKFGVGTMKHQCAATDCDSCFQPFTEDNPKSCDHDYIRFVYRGAVHRLCNLNIISNRTSAEIREHLKVVPETERFLWTRAAEYLEARGC